MEALYKIGVVKNQNVISGGNICPTSRTNTCRELANSAIPAASKNMKNNRGMEASIPSTLKCVPVNANTANTARYPIMCIKNVAVTVDSGSNSLANDTLPINAAFALTALADRRILSENAVHGQKAIARNGTKPISPASAIRALKMVEKTNAYTASNMSGCKSSHANPVRFSR